MILETPPEKIPQPWESVALVFVEMGLLLVMMLIAGFLNQSLALDNSSIFYLTLVGEILLIFPLLLWMWLRRYSWQETFQVKKASWGMIALSVLLGVLAQPIVSVVTLPFEWALSKIGESPMLPVPQTPTEMWIFGITVIVVAPLIEEPMFRGFVQQGWRRVGMWWAVLIAGGLFGILHGQLSGLVGLILVGILLGVVAYKSGSIIPAMVMHGTFNAISFLLLINETAIANFSDADIAKIAAFIFPLFIWTLILLVRQKAPKKFITAMPDTKNIILAAISIALVMGIFSIFAFFDILSRMLPI